MPAPVLLAWTVIGALSTVLFVAMVLLAVCEVLADRRDKRLAERELRDAEEQLSRDVEAWVWAEWNVAGASRKRPRMADHRKGPSDG